MPLDIKVTRSDNTVVSLGYPMYPMGDTSKPARPDVAVDQYSIVAALAEVANALWAIHRQLGVGVEAITDPQIAESLGRMAQTLAAQE